MPTMRTNMLLVCTFTRTHSITTSSLSPSIFPPDAPSQAYVPPLIDRYYSPSLHSLPPLISVLFSLYTLLPLLIHAPTNRFTRGVYVRLSEGSYWL
ncbi:hypothetical protein F5H01DRAFT_357170 [Linnemannia elongata]|nr:hypothetical protein F5H01DRAFT_357170 [Linnemannia elongata]